MCTLHSQHRPAWESGELTVPLLGVGQGGAADVPVACSAFLSISECRSCLLVTSSPACAG